MADSRTREEPAPVVSLAYPVDAVAVSSCIIHQIVSSEEDNLSFKQAMKYL
jgi:hypothetical protein